MNDLDRPEHAALRRLDDARLGRCVEPFAPEPAERPRFAPRRPPLRSVDRKRGPDS